MSTAAAHRPRSSRDRIAVGLVLLGCVIAGGAYAVQKLTAKNPTEQAQQPQQPQQPEPKHANPPLPGTRTIAEVFRSPDYEWSEPENLGVGVNSPMRESSPALTDDELTIVFMRDGRFWTSQRASIGDPFGQAVPLMDKPASPFREGHAITGDGLILVYSTEGDRPGESRIWEVTRANIKEPFGEPTELQLGKGTWFAAPAISSDGLTLLVTAARKTSIGSGDVYMFTRKSRNERFENETHLPEPVNSSLFDVATWISNDRNALIRIKMEKAPPHTCEWVSRPNNTVPFEKPQSFGIRGTWELGRPWISPDGMRAYFHNRDLPNGNGQLDLWMIRRIPKQ